jgi:transposase
VTHNRFEFARWDRGVYAHTNTCESVFGWFKRAIVGRWHCIGAKHLRRYGVEHEFRWNTRKTDVETRIVDRRDTFQFVGRELRPAPGKIRPPAFGWVRARGRRVPDGARLVQATIRQCPEDWDVAVRLEAAPPVAAPAQALPVVGIDGGLPSLATVSDGSVPLPHPRLSKKAAKRIGRLNRERDRRRKGSVNRRRTVARRGRADRAIARSRADYLHKASRRLVNHYAGFAVETLHLRGLRTRLAKSFCRCRVGRVPSGAPLLGRVGWSGMAHGGNVHALHWRLPRLRPDRRETAARSARVAMRRMWRSP